MAPTLVGRDTIVRENAILEAGDEYIVLIRGDRCLMWKAGRYQWERELTPEYFEELEEQNRLDIGKAKQLRVDFGLENPKRVKRG